MSNDDDQPGELTYFGGWNSPCLISEPKLTSLWEKSKECGYMAEEHVYMAEDCSYLAEKCCYMAEECGNLMYLIIMMEYGMKMFVFYIISQNQDSNRVKWLNCQLYHIRYLQPKQSNLNEIPSSITKVHSALS